MKQKTKTALKIETDGWRAREGEMEAEKPHRPFRAGFAWSEFVAVELR